MKARAETTPSPVLSAAFTFVSGVGIQLGAAGSELSTHPAFGMLTAVVIGTCAFVGGPRFGLGSALGALPPLALYVYFAVWPVLVGGIHQPLQLGLSLLTVASGLALAGLLYLTSLRRFRDRAMLDAAGRAPDDGTDAITGANLRRLAAELANELNNALAGALVHADNAARQPAPGLGPHTHLSATRAAIARAASATKLLLLVTRQFRPHPTEVDLRRFSIEFVPTLRETVAPTASPDCHGDLGTVKAFVDGAALADVVQALVTSAHQRAAAGSKIAIRSGRAKSLPHVGSERGGAYSFVAVDYIGTLRGEGTGLRSMIGAADSAGVASEGLGLVAARAFARLSGGAFAVEHDGRGGASLMLYLPATPPIGDEACDEAPTGIAKGTETILLVDDEPDLLEGTAEFLNALGYDVRSAQSAAEAMEQLRRGDIDALVTDLTMPGAMTGIELARWAAARQPELTVVLVSGYATPFGEDLGPWRLLEKPYGGDQLARAMRAELNRRTS